MRVILLAATAFVSVAQAANAQAPINRGKNESVTERPRPEYDPLGIRLGSFELLPTLTLGAETNDNVFATQTAAQEDIIFTVSPAVSLASDWSRHALRLHADSTSGLYQDFENEDYTNLNASGDFRLDVGRDANLGAGGSYFQGFEPRTSPDQPGAATKPVEFDMQNVYGYGLYTFNRLRVSGRAEITDYDYDNVFNAAGAIISQQYRDHSEALQTVRLEYALTPSAALVLQGQTSQNEYDLPPPGSLVDRDSTGYSIQAGANADLTNLIRGELIVGYLSEEWDNTNLSVDGLAVNGNLEYFITRLTTIKLSARRAVEETGLDFVAAAGKIATRAEARVDHELLRNVLLTAGVGGGSDEYEGIDRSDDVFQGDLGARYLLNRYATLGAHYYYTDFKSEGLQRDRDYNINRFLISLTLKL